MDLEGLDDLSTEGDRVLAFDDPVRAYQANFAWVNQVSSWLGRVAPDSGLRAEWLAQPGSSHDTATAFPDDPVIWNIFRNGVKNRLRWLAGLPSKMRLLEFTSPQAVQRQAKAIGRKEVKLQTTARAYVDPDRIDELSSITSPSFDLAKLVRMCEELNVCFAGECYFAIAMLTRAILDHVPPIFGASKFTEVANTYGGSKSFKDSMLNLENSSRKIADQHLHTQVRKSETLPTVRQVDFSNDLDVLLAEIVRVLKRP